MSLAPATHGFVLSSGRCGSTLLSNLLQAHSDVLSISEFFSVLGGKRAFSLGEVSGPALVAWLGRLDEDMRSLLRATHVPEILLALPGDRLADVPGPLLVTLPHLSDDPYALWSELAQTLERAKSAPVAQQYGLLFEHLRTRFARKLWVERSGGSIEYADELSHHFPAAHVIHLLRDGRDCAYSMARHPMFRVRLSRLLARDPTLPVERCLANDIPVDRFGAYWSALMHHTLRTLRTARDPARHLVVRYESLVTEPARELGRIAHLFGIEASLSAWVSAADRTIHPATSRWRTLATSERTSLDRACLPGMRVLDRALAKYT